MPRKKEQSKRNRSVTEPQWAHVRTTAINLSKLHKMKEWRYILKALRIFNDIAVSPFIAGRLSTSHFPHVKPVNDGISWTLLRWRISMAAEVFAKDPSNPSFIEYLYNHKQKKDHELWAVIRANSTLETQWEEIAEYFEGGEKEDFRKKIFAVRDRLTAHYDNGPINKAFERLVLLKKADTKAGAPVGFHLQGEAGIVRNLLADELLNIALYDIFGVALTENGADDEQIELFAQDLTSLLKLLANFINELVIHYLESNGLLEVHFDRPEWLPAEKTKERRV